MGRMKKRLWIGLALLLTVAGIAFHRPLIALGLHAGSSHGSPALAVGDTVPDFVVTDLAGKSWTLGDLQKTSESGVVSLTFWCTFCHSCRMIDGRLQALAADLKEKAAVLGIDASAADDARKVEDFAREKKFSVPVFLDPDGKAADLFGVRVTTTTVVIDKARVLRYRGQFGTDDSPHARNALRAVLDGRDVAVKETPPAG
jgi:cytochrome c biogenesis protein CcmG, thiol:disulfide interchange protein DsbE